MTTRYVFRELAKLGWSGIVKCGEPLAPYTSFRVGGRAELLVTPVSAEQVPVVVSLSRRAAVVLRVLGGGTNLLVSDKGVRGVVLCTRRLRGRIRDGSIVSVEAGVPLAALVQWAAREGLSGLEPLVGIPGTVGGAIVMNAGGKYGNIAKVVRSVVIVDRSGSVTRLPSNKIPFGYRTSGLDETVVLGCVLKLTPSRPAVVSRRCAEILREKKMAQPLSARSAGCFFKNPASGPAAGKLIEEAGLKGYRIGGASVSSKHANFILTDGTARAADVMAVANVVRSEVKKRYGIHLEFEVKVW